MSDDKNFNVHRDRRRETWHLSKSIGVTHILTTITILFVVAGYFTSNEVRISQLKGHVESLNYSIEGIKDERARDRREINSRLARVEEKIDRLIDKFVYPIGK